MVTRVDIILIVIITIKKEIRLMITAHFCRFEKSKSSKDYVYD